MKKTSFKHALTALVLLNLLPPLGPVRAGEQKPTLEKASSETSGMNLPWGRKLLLGQKSQGMTPGPVTWQTYLVKGKPVLTDANVKSAKVQTNPQFGQPEIVLVLDQPGREAFALFTASHIRQRLAIVIDDRVMAAPLIMSAIPGGRAMISMGGHGPDAKSEADVLATTLNSHALPGPLTLLAENIYPKGILLELELELEALVREQGLQLMYTLHHALAENRIPIRSLVPVSDSTIRLTTERPEHRPLVRQALSCLPYQLVLKPDRSSAQTLFVGLPPGHLKRIRESAIKETEAIISKRLALAALPGAEVRSSGTNKLRVKLPSSPFTTQAKELITRRGRLEFLELDDEDDFHLRQRASIPDGVKLDYHSYSGPDNKQRQVSFWSAQGPVGRKQLQALIERTRAPRTGD